MFLLSWTFIQGFVWGFSNVLFYNTVFKTKHCISLVWRFLQLSRKIRLVKIWVYENWKFSCKNEFNQFCKRIYVYIRKCLPREVLQKHFHLKSIIIFKISVLNNIICLVIFLEGHNDLKKKSHSVLTLISFFFFFKREVFSDFVAFSQYLNFYLTANFAEFPHSGLIEFTIFFAAIGHT